MGEIWGFETIGIAKSDEEMAAHLATTNQDDLGSKWAAGDIMYRDLDGDGKITDGSTLDEPGDKRIIGNSSPRFRFGLDLTASYKGFDFRAFFQGVMKRDAWLNDNMFWGATGGIWSSSCFTSHLDFFRPEGDEMGANLDAYFPRPLVDNYAKNQKVQTGYLQNAAYMRLKNLQIGYTLPNHITQKIGMSNVRIFSQLKMYSQSQDFLMGLTQKLSTLAMEAVTICGLPRLIPYHVLSQQVLVLTFKCS